MSDPVSVQDDGVKIKPELMEKENLYHCVFKEKVLLFFKDPFDALNCYEIEESEIVGKVKSCKNDDEVKKLLEEYIAKENLNNK